MNARAESDSRPEQPNNILPLNRPVLEILQTLQNEVANCRRCPRLREHCERIAAVKRRAFRDCEYWGKPVPSFGDPNARILILGLAPGAHGSNRTGRMFTGDRSGDWLYRALYQTGFASQPASISRDDGLALRDVYVTAAAAARPPATSPRSRNFATAAPTWNASWSY